jgi:hypothetical protein
VANPASIIAGSRIVASALRLIPPQAVIKIVDESTTSATPFNDAELLLPAAASTTYLFVAWLDYQNSLSGSFHYQIAVPAGATARFAWIGEGAASAVQTALTLKDGTSYTALISGVGTPTSGVMAGTLVTSITAGNLQVMWAGGGGGATGILHAQSFLAMWEITP